MERGRFIETRRGQASLLTKRQKSRFYFNIDQNPQSKHIQAADAVAFQKGLLAQMTRMKKSTYRSPLFLQMTFVNGSKTPPSIYKLPKNYLDLLETPRADAGIPRSHLLYANDRLVKGLVVRYRLGSSIGRPHIQVRAEPLRNFIADIDLVRRVQANDFQEEFGRWSIPHDEGRHREGPFQGEDEWDDDRFERFADLERDRDSWVRVVGQDGFEAHRLLTRSQVQQQHLRHTDLITCRGLLWLFSERLRQQDAPNAGLLARLVEGFRDMMLSPPFVMDLHHAPQRNGDTTAFKQAVKVALEEYKRDHRMLFPLSALLNVTILMVPPIGGGKDLDNLAHLILPAVHDILQPPSNILRLLDVGSVRDKSLRGQWEAARAALPNEPKHSITQYRAFELPRFPGDPEEGFVRLAVGDGFTPVQFREEIDDFLAGWQRCLPR